jgi:hypothetical protein
MLRHAKERSERMLISRETFGVSLSGPLEQASSSWEALLEEMTAAGAGMVRVPWSGAEDPTARQAAAAAAALRLTVVAVCDPDALRPEGAAGLSAVAEAADGAGCYLELRLSHETATEVANRALVTAGDLPIVLGLGPAEAPTPLPPPEDLSRWDAASIAAVGVEVASGEDDDPKRIEEPLRAFAGGLRAHGMQQPIWPTVLGEPPAPASADHGAAASDGRAARLLKFGAHALALGVPKLFLKRSETDPEATLRAIRALAAWLDGARRITWLARGQYRAEFVDRPNRYLLWAEPEIQRLPSSLMGPLTLRDLAGEERRIETTNLRLADSPVLVERR